MERREAEDYEFDGTEDIAPSGSVDRHQCLQASRQDRCHLRDAENRVTAFLSTRNRNEGPEIARQPPRHHGRFWCIAVWDTP